MSRPPSRENIDMEEVVSAFKQSDLRSSEEDPEETREIKDISLGSDRISDPQFDLFAKEEVEA
jgi:hypothetical protein